MHSDRDRCPYSIGGGDSAPWKVVQLATHTLFPTLSLRVYGIELSRDCSSSAYDGTSQDNTYEDN